MNSFVLASEKGNRKKAKLVTDKNGVDVEQAGKAEAVFRSLEEKSRKPVVAPILEKIRRQCKHPDGQEEKYGRGLYYAVQILA
ncbi:hypothetical protein OMP40_04955 [Cohnella rhizosphaerae]|uniref:Uncharacterized protein n=1 Tax=Cohnella rhizosphaerae TaxID=1457232 RepID=A0A9X4KQR4_9BACL|nr:hypothetical protein [Cohnella rhizosphaerae]MDG0808808.1 hypothetical protein [Cohnella rhizosphaerae]